jgi:hypothetical protein|tara:strand:- start:185 stop:352 length:168 start_codon:yes stop_codon:yes gene_type:complete
MSKVTKIETEHSIITIEAKESDLEFDKRVGIVSATDNGRALARAKDALGMMEGIK